MWLNAADSLSKQFAEKSFDTEGGCETDEPVLAKA